MKIFLFGDWRTNAGPANVNRSLIEHSDNTLLYIRSNNPLIRLLEVLLKIILSDVVVFSMGGRISLFRIAKHLGKKIAVIKHGDTTYEKKINHLNTSDKVLHEDIVRMDLADAIICVSEKYVDWVTKQYPQYKYKLTWINNGITISPRSKKNKDKHVIALGGGNRGIKNNLNVLKAVDSLNSKGLNLNVKLFGRLYKENPDLSKFSFVKLMGQMNKKEYYSELDNSALYVDAAYCEPFGLSIADAINCNCSLLLSDNVGFLSVIKAQDTDIVHNCDDINEIASKLEYLLSHPNAERLLSTINVSNCSEEYAYKRLKKICTELLDNKILK